MEREIVTIVDDNIANLKLGKNALSGYYDVLSASSAERMFELLKLYTPQLILLDINMPGMDGYEAIKVLKSNPDTADIPVIFLTGKSEPESELEGLKLGAVDYILKPFLPELLYKRVELHLTIERQQRQLKEQDAELREFNDNLRGLVKEKTQNVLNLQAAILRTVAELVERRDGDTGGHVMRTQRYLRALLDAILERGLYPDEIDRNWDLDLIVLSSQLHDVGKIEISDNILLKPGKLTTEEFNEIKKHTIYGAEIIERMMNISVDNDFLKYARVFAETHQEKWNGMGYPYGLKEREIPLLGRVMAIADVYDALISERPYKKPFAHEDAVGIILEGKGSHFDPVLVDIFESLSDDFKKMKDLPMQPDEENG